MPKFGLKWYGPMFFDFVHKPVSARPFVIKESAKITDFLTSGFLKFSDYQIIKDDFETGRDISKYLSKTSLKVESDDLLWDWRIHHLHVETVIDPNDTRFVARSSFQLFFLFGKGNCLFYRHQAAP